ncbi:hypothetical protein PoB_004785800 [Plakobranchus ocellatus]|uniref:Uncharacterized protein n=1 Tax=Plakobranchus ocellatus TaxID=259542 RepID=A0AAV4BP48_9GAST|nr:hypothetical protein PoB_004785800 [Plakobranchus ocellatus]
MDPAWTPQRQPLGRKVTTPGVGIEAFINLDNAPATVGGDAIRSTPIQTYIATHRAHPTRSGIIWFQKGRARRRPSQPPQRRSLASAFKVKHFDFCVCVCVWDYLSRHQTQQELRQTSQAVLKYNTEAVHDFPQDQDFYHYKLNISLSQRLSKLLVVLE